MLTAILIVTHRPLDRAREIRTRDSRAISRASLEIPRSTCISHVYREMFARRRTRRLDHVQREREASVVEPIKRRRGDRSPMGAYGVDVSKLIGAAVNSPPEPAEILFVTRARIYSSLQHYPYSHEQRFADLKSIASYVCVFQRVRRRASGNFFGRVQTEG